MDKAKIIEEYDNEKLEVWHDDDEYEIGYNNGIEDGKDLALWLFKEQQGSWSCRNVTSHIINLPYYKAYECSQCGSWADQPYQFCPTCGAIMDSEIEQKPKRTQEYAPIIRCKDCKHAVMTVRGEVKYCKLWQGSEDGSYGGDPLYLEGDFFCAYAEGKEEC